MINQVIAWGVSSTHKSHIVFRYGPACISPRAVCGLSTARLTLEDVPTAQCESCARLAADQDVLRRKAVAQFAEVVFGYPHLANAIEGILRVIEGRRSR